MKRLGLSRRHFSVCISSDAKHLQVKGVDTKKFLQSMCTNDVTSLKKRGDAIPAAFLNTKGRVIADAVIVDNSISSERDAESVILEVNKGLLDSLVKHLSTYKLRSKVSLSVLPMRTKIYQKPVDGLCFEDPRSSHLGFKQLTYEKEEESNVAILSVDANKHREELEYARYRLLNGISEGSELLNSIPLEMNLDFLNYINFTKGCYIGQELIARTYFKGQIRKRLVPFIVVHADFVKVDIQSGFRKLNQSLLDSVYSRDVNSFPSLSVPSVGSTIRSYSSSDILVSPGSGQGCSGHGRFSGENDDSVGTIETQTSIEEVGEVVSINQSLGLGLALVRLTSLYGIDQDKRLFMTDSNNKARIVLFQPMWWPQTLDPQTGKASV